MKRPQPIKYAGGYKVDFLRDGLRHRLKFPYTRYPEPKAAAQQYIDQVTKPDEESVSRDTGGDITKTLRAYLNWGEKIKGKSSRTMRSERQRLGRFDKFASERELKYVSHIDVNVIREFQLYYFQNAPFTLKPAYRRTGANPKATWEKYRQNLSAFCNWCVSRNFLKKNPLSMAAEFKVKTQARIPEIFTVDELNQLFVWFDNLNSVQISAFYRLLAYTGVRLGEAIRLTWRSVDLTAGMIKIESTKNYEPRLIPISDRLRPYLEALPKKHFLFDGGRADRAEPLYMSSWWLKLLNKATDECGIPRRNVHSFRHTFCSALMSAGVNIKTVMYLAGHKRIETTLIYTHFAQVEKQAAIEKLPF